MTDEDEVLKDLPEAGEYAPFIGVGYLGLFGLRLMRGLWSVQGCLLRCVGEEEAAGKKVPMEISEMGVYMAPVSKC